VDVAPVGIMDILVVAECFHVASRVRFEKKRAGTIGTLKICGSFRMISLALTLHNICQLVFLLKLKVAFTVIVPFKAVVTAIL
jgi:hypothetical protein